MNNIFQLILLSMIYSQDVFEGYTLFTPGAGGGGFMLFFVPPRRHQRVSDALNGYQQVKFRCDQQGSRIIFSG